MITTIPPQTQDISTVDALWVLIQNQSKSVRKALVKRILDEYEQQLTMAQQQMVKDSLTRAFDELHSGKVHHNARDLFKK
jgi:anion-transporting  ArsA/GET3 family ATPase